MPKDEKNKRRKKQKPKIDYKLSDDGNVIDASVDKRTHFISLKRTVQSRKKGGLGFGAGFKAEGEKSMKDDWVAVVWENGTLMPESVWNEKRRKELLETISTTITTATGSPPVMSAHSGTVIPWNFVQSTKCPHCGEEFIAVGGAGSKFCPRCGKPLS